MGCALMITKVFPLKVKYLQTEDIMYKFIICFIAGIEAVFANKASARVLNRATGIVLSVMGVAIIVVNYMK